MLYQVKITIPAYEECKRVELKILELSSKNLAFHRERNEEDLELHEREVKKKIDANRELFEVLDPRINFLKEVIHHYEHVLQSYARLAMFSRFENLESILSGCNIPSKSSILSS